MYTPIDAPAASRNERQSQEVRKALINVIDDEYLLSRLGNTWSRLGGRSVTGSSLDEVQRAGTIYLLRLTRQADFMKMKIKSGIPEDYAFHVDKNGELWAVEEKMSRGAPPDIDSTEINVFFYRVSITPHAKAAIPGIVDDLKLLANLARQAGGTITSNGRISIGQWLQFHGLPQPGTKEDTQQLIDVLNFANLPARPPLENYWQLLDTPEDSPFRLTETTRSIIDQQTRQLKDDASFLIKQIGARLIRENAGSEMLPTSIEYRMQRLLEIARQSCNQGQNYLIALGWFGEGSGEKASQQFIDQLLIAAMLLDLDPEIDSANTSFAGFDIYAKRFLQQKPGVVQLELEKHLANHFQLHQMLTPLVAQWILAGMAPQFLIRNLPPELQVGTPGWVVFSQAVHLVEAVAPGTSRLMSYEHLLGFSLVPGLMPQLASLHTTNNLDPVVTWALMNELVERDADGSLSQKTVLRAVEEYDRYVTALTRAVSDVNTPIPSRRAIALKELTSKIPRCNPNELLVKHRGNGGGAGRKVSVLDLYMGDELHTTDWGRIRGKDIYQEFPELKDLYPANDLYEEAIHAHYNGITTALSTNIRYALSQLHQSDRSFIEHGRLAIYQVKKDIPKNIVGTLKPIISALSPIAGLYPLPDPVADPGRYGVILCAVKGPLIRCYELFPLRLDCRFNQVFRNRFSYHLISDPVGGNFVDSKLLLDAPIDLEAYVKNITPRDDKNASVVLTKIGEFGTSAHDTTASNPVQYFKTRRIEDVSNLIAEHNPYINKEELSQIGFDQTDRELAIEKTDKVFNVILNLIIPFKECIEELSSGVPSRQKGAIAGCVMEAALIAISLVAAPLKIVAGFTKGATLVTKLLSASRVAARTVIGLFNPLSGVPQLLKGGGKLIGRSLAKLSVQSAPHFARKQLLRLTGTSSYDLLKAVNHSGAASELRMTLDAVGHGRAIFKNDSIETAEHVLKHLYDNDKKLLQHIPEQELQHLMEISLADIALKSDSALQLRKILDSKVVDTLTRRHAQTFYLDSLHQFKDVTVLPEALQDALRVEYKNLVAMQAHQQELLTKNLGKAPYHGVLDESRFNPHGLTDNTDRATAWILNASNSENETNAIRTLLLEYAGSNKPLTDPAIYNELHRRVAPNALDQYRSPRPDVRYPSNISGTAMLEHHMAKMDPAHEHFGKHLFGSFLGYHAYSDGNGRTARAIYAITELRKGRFNALDRPTENALSGLN